MDYVVKEDFTALPFYHDRSVPNPNTVPLKAGDVINVEQTQDMLGGNHLIVANSLGNFEIPSDKVEVYTVPVASIAGKTPSKFGYKDIIVLAAVAGIGYLYFKMKR